MSKILSIIILSISSFILYLPHVHAESIGLSVSPPVLEILLAPNHKATHTLTLRNHSNSGLTYSLSFHPLLPTDDLGHATITLNPLDINNSPLLPTIQNRTLDTEYFLSAGQSINLTLQLESATLDQAKDFYLALAITAHPGSSLPNNSLTTPILTVPIFVTMTPLSAIPTDVELSNFSIPHVHDSSKKIQITPQIKNKSPIMLRIKGSLTLSSPSDKTLHESTFDPTLVLGKNSRSLPIFDFQPSSFTIGPHTLKIIIQTEGGRTLLESEKVVFIAPFKMIFLVFTVLLFLTVLRTRFSRLTTSSTLT